MVLFLSSLYLDGLKSITTICSEPMALIRESSVGSIYIVANDFNPLKIKVSTILSSKEKIHIYFFLSCFVNNFPKVIPVKNLNLNFHYFEF